MNVPDPAFWFLVRCGSAMAVAGVLGAVLWSVVVSVRERRPFLAVLNAVFEDLG